MIRRLAMSGLIGAGLVGLGLSMGACASTPNRQELATAPGQIEAVQAAAFTRDTILLRVNSNGCTDKEDIKPLITMLKSRAVMTLHRLEEDTCKARLTDGITLQWTFDELGLEPGTLVEVGGPYSLPHTGQ